MKEEREMITANNFFLFLKIYNSKKLEFERYEICNFMGITVNNSNTYNKMLFAIISIEVILCITVD